jgi:hypothetical protein
VKEIHMANDSGAIRAALVAEFQARGLAVGGDTVSLRGVLYIQGNGDRAAALFELKDTAEEAMETMYQGRWMPEMPPRFAVLPLSEKGRPELDLLRQAGLSFLLYEALEGDRDGAVVFPELDADLAVVMGRLGTSHSSD